VRADVAEQAAVLVGAVLLVLEIERAPLSEDGEAEEYQQTDGPSVHELGPSRHFFDYMRDEGRRWAGVTARLISARA
jgi:hypothetical protein